MSTLGNVSRRGQFVILQNLAGKIFKKNERPEENLPMRAGLRMGARRHVGVRIISESQIKCDDMERGEMLPLVFMDAFHLHIEERLWRDFYPGTLGNEHGKPSFVREL